MADTASAQAAMPATGALAASTNGVTTGASNATSDQNTANRGLPYYEKLRRELRDTIQKKRLMDKSMVSPVSRQVAPDRHCTRRSVAGKPMGVLNLDRILPLTGDLDSKYLLY
jgi:hypothetical protein